MSNHGPCQLVICFAFFYIELITLINALDPLYNIYTVMGTGSSSEVNVGNGIPVIDSPISVPRGVTGNSKGELFIAESGLNRIRYINGSGYVFTVAGVGTGTGSLTGTGGPAIQAKLAFPYGIDLGKDDEIFLVENGKSVIRKVVNQTILAVTGLVGSSGFSGDGGDAINSQLADPYGIAVSKITNEVFIADSANRIRKIWNNGTITTIAQVSRPMFLVLSHDDELYIPSDCFVKKMSKDGTISIIGGTGDCSYYGDGGLASSAAVNTPHGVSVDLYGNTYIADYYNNRVRKITKNGIMTTIAGNGVDDITGSEGSLATDVAISSPEGIYTDSNTGIVYFSTYNYVKKLVPFCTEGVFMNGTCVFECYGKKNIEQDVCGGHGFCEHLNNCSCPSGWKGSSDCSVPSCEEVNNCTGRGFCIGNNTCKCDSGWNGDRNCSNISCDALNECSGHGICISNNTCQCNSGWLGNSQCSAHTCDALNNCTDHGSCISNNTCQCNSGWNVNAQCSQFTCKELNNCSENGICGGPNSCACDSGWKGNSQCSKISCDSLNECYGNGECVSNNTCSCNVGWKGNENCSQFTCELFNSCSGHGSCISNNTCKCDSGWKGNVNCSKFTCDGWNECSGHGVCLSNNTCLCETHWKNWDCSVSECIISMNSNNELICSIPKVFSFNQLLSNTLNNIWIDMENGNLQIYSPANTNIEKIPENSNYFISSSSVTAFQSSVIHLILQNSTSSIIQTPLTNSIKYYFNNLVLDLKLYNYTCVRYDYNAKLWSTESISTQTSQNQIICETNIISTSVSIQKSAVRIESPISAQVSPKVSDRISESSRNQTSLLSFFVIILSIIYIMF